MQLAEHNGPGPPKKDLLVRLVPCSDRGSLGPGEDSDRMVEEVEDPRAHLLQQPGRETAEGYGSWQRHRGEEHRRGEM